MARAPERNARKRIRRRLLDWYGRHRRDLPWRRSTDPYRIWVSEVMLQQTRVGAVLPFYARFLERFPDPASLARASEEEVLGYWSGLGYYRRARSLHAGARAVMELHGGRIPDRADALRALPGIGRYTAGAIASIAFGHPEPVLDGNVRRVLCRLRALASRPGSPEERDTLWGLASALVEGEDPGGLNQALMELGALVCTPRNPGCDRCPVARDCRGRASGEPERFPTPRPRAAIVRTRVAVAWIEHGARVLFERPGAGSPLRGYWELPARTIDDDRSPQTVLERALAEQHGLRVEIGDLLARARHSVLDRRMELELYAGRRRRGRIAGRLPLRWVDPLGSPALATSGAARKLMRARFAAACGRPDGRFRRA